MLELFTFLRSGGSYGQIDVRTLDLDATEAVALFDIRKADCFLKEDKQALLAIVEASYGSFLSFNEACRKILIAKLGADRRHDLDDFPTSTAKANGSTAKYELSRTASSANRTAEVQLEA